MKVGRRKFVSITAGAVLGNIMINPNEKLAFATSSNLEIKAIAFDAFPIFDPRTAFKIVKEQFPNQCDDLIKLWFSKIFSYTWLLTSGNQYGDFWRVMEDALRFSTASMKVELTPEKQMMIMNAFLYLPIWPDVKQALEQWRDQNIRLALLSNMTEEMLRKNLRYNGIEESFEFVLSTDYARVFKPGPKSYQLGVNAFDLKKEEIVFAAFAGWDAVGASWFGYPTVWVNRLGLPAEELDSKPKVIGRDMKVLKEFIQKSKQGR